MLTTMRATRICDESGRHVLTLHVDPSVFNYPGRLQALSDLLGQTVMSCVGPVAMDTYEPRPGYARTRLPGGWYKLLFGIRVSENEMIWRQRTSSFYIQGRDDDDDNYAPPEQPLELVFA